MKSNFLVLKVLSCFTFLFLFGCQLNSTKCPKSSNILKTKKQSISIDTFSTFPPEIDGCSCYFSKDSTDFINGAYIYMNDYNKISFLKINGVLTKFTQTNFKQITKSKSISKSASENYELTIEVRKAKQNGDETSLFEGTIKLKDKNGKIISSAFYGECGC